ncbi:MAG: glycoside hydrolase family 15 protein [Myxococcaceae bacterium]|nr:glycoside hydrolase family 15 protein [Myxococcaceae bacterium]
MTARRRIEDYALIGDTQTAALVSRDGAIEWMCAPRFDSPAFFASLLGEEDHGCWRIAPRSRARRVERRYRKGTLILETDFHTSTGTVRLIDFMPPRDGVPDLVRVVEGVSGRVEVAFTLRPRFDYGRLRPWIRQSDVRDWLAVAGPDSLGLYAPVKLDCSGTDILGTFPVEKGDRIPFVLTWSPSNRPMTPAVKGLRELDSTERWWRRWIAHCTYRGIYEDAVTTSLAVLKALTYEPTGGVVAAPTTSLPEEPGGTRNWDYRYCWLRDATFTLYALMMNGFEKEARAWRDWLLRAVASDPGRMQIMYGCAGERQLHEYELEWLPGFEGSVPVRVGNDAARQFQLDTYGEVLDLLHQARVMGIPSEESAWSLQRRLLDWLELNGARRDKGIWEVRGKERFFTHSRVMLWVAFDRAIRGAERFGLEGPVERWRAFRDELRHEVLTRGYSSTRRAFTQSYGSKELDAAVLMIPLVGFLPATDERMVNTVRALERELLDHGFLRRYRNRDVLEGLGDGTEGAFIACSFWYADNLVLQGRQKEARRLFERLLSIRNDLGLLAEEYDPVGRRLLGNFPQAFSHVALLNTARHLAGEGPAHHRRKAGSDG